MKEDIIRKLNGEGIGIHDPEAEEYNELLNATYDRIQKFNTMPTYSVAEIHRAFSEIVGYEVDSGFKIVPPFRCDLGFNIKLGKNVLINYNCTFLDAAEISVGDDTMIGPDCHFVTACHYLEPEKRFDKKCYGRPIKIGRNCWFGANVTVLPGITIGDNAVIGAGSVVTKDVPDGTTVVGNPARPLKKV